MTSSSSEVPQGHPLGSVFEAQGFSRTPWGSHRIKPVDFGTGGFVGTIFSRGGEQVSDFIEEMIQSEVILNLGIKDDCSECGWLTLQWILKETIAAAYYCRFLQQKRLDDRFSGTIKVPNEACVINL